MKETEEKEMSWGEFIGCTFWFAIFAIFIAPPFFWFLFQLIVHLLLPAISDLLGVLSVDHPDQAPDALPIPDSNPEEPNI